MRMKSVQRQTENAHLYNIKTNNKIWDFLLGHLKFNYPEKTG